MVIKRLTGGRSIGEIAMTEADAEVVLSEVSMDLAIVQPDADIELTMAIASQGRDMLSDCAEYLGLTDREFAWLIRFVNNGNGKPFARLRSVDLICSFMLQHEDGDELSGMTRGLGETFFRACKAAEADGTRCRSERMTGYVRHIEEEGVPKPFAGGKRKKRNR
jgi:hypothetical protein